jgi:predicted RNase H-like nuclease
MRQAEQMHFVGVDLAWGEINQSGIAVVDADGRLLHVGTAQDDASIGNALSEYVGDECLVAFDAPLIVKNPVGYRPCEKALNRDFHKFEAGARPAYTGRPEFARVPRAARLAEALRLDMNPRSAAPRRAIEVYPHPATVVLFGLDRTLKYKRGAVDTRRRELLHLMTLIEQLDQATPRLRVNHNVAWVELRNRVTAATRPGQLDGAEDPVDAVVCAYIAQYWYHRPDDTTTYGDFATGYIVTPSIPPELAAPAQPERDADEVEERLARIAALLEEAQLELDALREVALNPQRRAGDA